MISEIDDKIFRVKETLNDIVINLKSKNDIVLEDIIDRINISEDMLNTIPSVERELINIERHYDLSEQIYLLLLTKKTEAEILSAGNLPDSKIVEPAIINSGTLTYPNSRENYILAFLIGIFFPFFIFTLIELFYNKIANPLDIEKNSDIPFLGYIVSNSTGFDLIVQKKPKSIIAESFRNIRSNIEFILPKHEDGKVILFTSSISGEGKTFCVKNLGSAYAISGKKTILIGADLRKPRLYLSFDQSNDIGLSTYLSGNSTLKEILKQSKFNNIDFIGSGPIPPNPAELVSNEKMLSLIKLLKKEYDYIIIDTPPAFIVSDVVTIMKHVDLNIYVTRQNYTNKDLLNNINQFYSSKEMNNLSILLNDVNFSNNYAYNYNYNYYHNYSEGYYDDL